MHLFLSLIFISIHLLWNLCCEHCIIKVLLWWYHRFHLITSSSLLATSIARAHSRLCFPISKVTSAFINIRHGALLTPSSIWFIIFSDHDPLYWVRSLWLDLHQITLGKCRVMLICKHALMPLLLEDSNLWHICDLSICL